MRIFSFILFVNAGLAISAWSLPGQVQQQADLIEQFRQGLLADWAGSWKNHDSLAFSRLCAEKTTVEGWTGRRELFKENDGIGEYKWKAGNAKELDRSAIAKTAAAYLRDFSSIADVSLTVVGFFREPGSSEARIELNYDLRGRLKDGSLRTDRGVLEVGLRLDATSWKIEKILDRAMETLQAKRLVFEDATFKFGLSGVARHARQEAIRRGGYALAVADYDASGRPSIYIGGFGKAQLYHRGEDGVFKDITLQAGLGQDTLVKSAVFADFDNDGKTDLLAQRFVQEAGPELKFYRNIGNGKFVEAKAVVERKAVHDRAMSMAAADFNGDGFTDLYVGYPGTRDFTDGRLDAPGGMAHQGIYMNRGEWKFEEVLEVDAPRLSADLVRPHSALVSDLDGDGISDILVVDDRGNSSKIYLNKGDEKFRSAALELGLSNQGWGMVAVAGDYDGDGKEDIYFTNVDFSAGRLLLRLLDQSGLNKDGDAGLARARTIFAGNRLFRAAGADGFVERTENAGVGWSGEASAGAAWVDYNNDGLLDLYVANGLWSANPKKSYDNAFVADLISGVNPEDASADNPVMRRLQRSGESFGGYQRNRLYRNNGDGTFTEVGYVTGTDRLEDGYVVATADIDRDGRADLILRNADPADLKVDFLPVTVLHNKHTNENKSLAVYVRSIGGAPAFGARVIVRAGGKSQTREIRSVEGAVQSEAMAFVGLGSASQADSVEVRWPTGKVSHFKNVAAGRILVEEGLSDTGQLTRLAALRGTANRRE